MLRTRGLHERRLIANGVELAFGFVVEQLDLARGKIAGFQYFFQLFAFERRSADDRYPIKIAAHASPEDCGSCISAEAGCGFVRRNAKKRRASTPESM